MNAPAIKPLSANEQAAYDAILHAAQRGLPCPSNDTLACIMDCGSIGTPPRAVRSLEKRGLIKVDRFQQARQVTIVATGEQTKEPRSTVLHWRQRKGRTRAEWCDMLADLVAEHGDRVRATKELGLSASYGRVLWGDIVRGLGWQAA